MLDTWFKKNTDDDIILQHLEEMVSEIMLGEIVVKEIQTQLQSVLRFMTQVRDMT